MADRVYKRTLKDGTNVWDAVAHIPDPVTGKRKKVQQTFKKERDGKKWVTEQESAVDKGTAILPNSMTVAELMAYWLEHHIRHQKSGKTHVTYEAQIRLHIVPHLGKVKVQKLTAAQVQQWQTTLLDAGVGPRTVQLAHLNLGQALDVAVKMDMVPRNVVSVVDQPRYKAREMECWTADEARRFVAVADQSIYGPIWLLALVTGLRKGELLGLRWQDIDWEAKTLRVVQTIGSLKGEVEFKGTKRPQSKRTLDLDDRILAILREHKSRQNERRLKAGDKWQKHNLVFTSNSSSGTPIHPVNCGRDFDRLSALAGVKRIRIHDTRHSYTTLALLAGQRIDVVSRSLGHTDIALTLRVYSHIMPEQSKELAHVMGSLLLGESAV